MHAEPLTAQAFRPFGQVIGLDDVRIELRADEEFHLDIISYDRKPIRASVLNRHHNATQALVGGAEALDGTDATLGINRGLRTWHEGPFPLGPHVDLVNVQGRHVLENDNEVAHLERDLGVVVDVAL